MSVSCPVNEDASEMEVRKLKLTVFLFKSHILVAKYGDFFKMINYLCIQFQNTVHGSTLLYIRCDFGSFVVRCFMWTKDGNIWRVCKFLISE